MTTPQDTTSSNRRSSAVWPVLVALSTLVIVNIYCGIRTIGLTSRREVLKEDYARINDIGNGLLSVDVWKVHLENIVSDRITHLAWTPQQEADLKIEIGNILQALITQTDTMMKQPQPTFKGKLQKVAFKTFINVPKLRANTPQFAQTILDEVKKPANLERLKEIALTQLNSYAAQTHDNLNKGPSQKDILATYNAKTPAEFSAHAGEELDRLERSVRRNVALMLSSLIAFLVAWWLVRNKPEFHKPLFALSVTLAFVLLLSGLALPMIDIDARINHVDFLLMGEHVQFNDQLIFYRSKSIMQMFKILVESHQADSIFVGLLLLLFSIAFPILKLLAALGCLFKGDKWKSNKVVHFFAFNSGKWSMSDVLVVAIFMAYIGFNGIMNSQVKDLKANAGSLQLIATNNTSLQPGFILFLSFVLFGLVLSEILKRIDRTVSREGA